MVFNCEGDCCSKPRAPFSSPSLPFLVFLKPFRDGSVLPAKSRPEKGENRTRKTLVGRSQDYYFNSVGPLLVWVSYPVCCVESSSVIFFRLFVFASAGG